VVTVEHEQRPEVLRQVATLLVQENDRLVREVSRLRAENARLRGETPGGVQQELEILKELLDRREQELFGRSSEKRPLTTPESTPTETPARPPRRGHGPTPQPRLPHLETRVELPAAERGCPACGGQLAAMAGQTEDSEEITVVERQYVLRTIQRQKYRCRCNGAVVTAPAPSEPKLIPGGRYSADFASHVAVAKYADHLPLDRQVQMMARAGLDVTSSVLWDQIEALARVLAPCHDSLYQRVRTAEVIGCDESRWRLLQGGAPSWWVWCVQSEDAIYYRVMPGRSKERAGELLDAYSGWVVTDGCPVYSSSARGAPWRWAACWAHVRRKFVEAQAHAPAEATFAIDRIRELYAIEATVPSLPWDASPEQRAEAWAARRRLRGECSRPILARLRDWGYEVTPQVLEGSGIGHAVAYMLKLWPELTRFVDEPRLPLDNNATERALRSPVVGRKNHYGSKSVRGTEVAALFYSLIESAELVGVNPEAYLREATRSALASPGTVTLPIDLLD
jgi:transposase